MRQRTKNSHWKTDQRLNRILRNIMLRCNYPGANRYECYGGRGVRAYLELWELEYLWVRDGASHMKDPSIDRKDPDGNYEVDNCRFIEKAKNVRRANKCGRCEMIARGLIKGICKECRRYRTCCKCKTEFVSVSRILICPTCRTVTKPCLQCGAIVVRDVVKHHGFIRNNKTFCARECFWNWFGAGSWRRKPKAKNNVISIVRNFNSQGARR